MANRCQQAPYCVYHSLGHNFFISAQDGGNEGRPPCKGVEEEDMIKGEEEEKVLRISHNLFNTTLHPLVAGLEYQGAVKTLKNDCELDLHLDTPTPLYCDVGLAHLVNAGYAKLSTTKLISPLPPPALFLSHFPLSHISLFHHSFHPFFPSIPQCC